MTISSVSSNVSAYQSGSAQGNFKQARQDLRDLAGALQSGDLPGAQKAFSALQQLMQGVQQSGKSQSQGDGTQSQFGTDLAALGKALQSGDMSSAQDAFKKLQQDMQAAVQGHHHHHHHADSAQGTNSVASPMTAPNATGAKDSDGDHDGSVGKTINVRA